MFDDPRKRNAFHRRAAALWRACHVKTTPAPATITGVQVVDTVLNPNVPEYGQLREMYLSQRPDDRSEEGFQAWISEHAELWEELADESE